MVAGDCRAHYDSRGARARAFFAKVTERGPVAAHVIDSALFGSLYGSERMRALFEERALLQRWLDYEAALARAQANRGLVPAAAAAEITRQARAELYDLEILRAGIERTAHPLVPLIWQLSEGCEGEAGRWVHWGATTQDVMDTALVLQLRDALALLEETAARLADALAELAGRTRATLMAGRTHGQQALPITFGFKVAMWLAELGRSQRRLAGARERALVGQFGGAVGTLAGMAEGNGDAIAVQRALMAELGLEAPKIAWHSSRDNLVECAVAMGMTGALCGRIAKEIIELQKTEFGELEEPHPPGKVGSSTMPQKRNPMLCESILTMARLMKAPVSSALDTLLLNEHERDWSAVQMEWAWAPELCVMCQGALELTLRVVTGLQVNEARMRQNLECGGGLLLAERVMFALAQEVGRQRAHDVVHRCAMAAQEQGLAFSAALGEEPLVARHLSAERIAELLDPAGYTGHATHFVDEVLAAHAEG